MWSLIKNEPAAFQAVIVSAIAAATSFGLEWTAEQVAAITSFTAVTLGFLTRTLVTPNTKLKQGDSTQVTVETKQVKTVENPIDQPNKP